MILPYQDEGLAPSYVDESGCLCLAPTVIRVERVPNPWAGLVAVLLSACVGIGAALWLGVHVVGPSLFFLIDSWPWI